MIGAYQSVPDFAYPGWRLRIPGGPAGGHYKGFLYNYMTPEIPAADQYEADRNAGAASHDAAIAPASAPRGVYRSPGEVPPRPNASGRSMVFRGYQVQRHPGTSEAPGAFPAPFVETPEDFFIDKPEYNGVIADPANYPVSSLPSPSPVVDDPGSNPDASPRPAPTVSGPVDFSYNTRFAAPASPRPGPIVRAPRDAYQPAHQTRTGMHGLGQSGFNWSVNVGGGSTFTSWMDQETIWPGVSNKWVIGGALAFIALMARRRSV